MRLGEPLPSPVLTCDLFEPKGSHGTQEALGRTTWGMGTPGDHADTTVELELRTGGDPHRLGGSQDPRGRGVCGSGCCAQNSLPVLVPVGQGPPGG